MMNEAAEHEKRKVVAGRVAIGYQDLRGARNTINPAISTRFASFNPRATRDKVYPTNPLRGT